jgi:hypothetical protein
VSSLGTLEQVAAMINAGLNMEACPALDTSQQPGFKGLLSAALSRQSALSNAVLDICAQTLRAEVAASMDAEQIGTVPSEQKLTSYKPFARGGVQEVRMSTSGRMRLQFEVRFVSEFQMSNALLCSTQRHACGSANPFRACCCHSSRKELVSASLPPGT